MVHDLIAPRSRRTQWAHALLLAAMLVLAACVGPAPPSRWRALGLTPEQATVAAAAERYLPQDYPWTIVDVEDWGDEWFVNFRPEPPPPDMACFGCGGAWITLRKPGLALDSITIDQ
jgi:hypothetical protein